MQRAFLHKWQTSGPNGVVPAPVTRPWFSHCCSTRSHYQQSISWFLLVGRCQYTLKQEIWSGSEDLVCPVRSVLAQVMIIFFLPSGIFCPLYNRSSVLKTLALRYLWLPPLTPELQREDVK